MGVSSTNGVSLGNLVSAETDPLSGRIIFSANSTVVPIATNTSVGSGYRVASGNLIDDWATTYGSATWSTSSSGGSGVAPTAGTPRVTLNTGTASTNYGRVIHRAPFNFGPIADTDSIVLDLEFPYPGPENGDSMTITISSDDFASKSLLLGITFQRYQDGRVQLAYKASDWTVGAGETFVGTTFNYLSMKYTRGTGTLFGAVSKQVIIHGIRFASKSRPKVVLAFDAGYSGVYDYVKPMMDAVGMVATVNVTRASIDTATFMTTTQLQALYAAGWDMGVRNGAQHDTFATLPLLTAEMVAAKAWNVDRGMSRGSNHCIYPVGVMTENSRAALIAAGFNTARTTFTRYVTPEVGSAGVFTLPCLSMSGASYYATAKAYIDDCIALGKTAFMYTHQVAPSLPAGGLTTADVSKIIDYLADKQAQGILDVCTISQWYSGLGQTGI